MNNGTEADPEFLQKGVEEGVGNDISEFQLLYFAINMLPLSSKCTCFAHFFTLRGSIELC